jgi:hypothetical protein
MDHNQRHYVAPETLKNLAELESEAEERRIRRGNTDDEEITDEIAELLGRSDDNSGT